MRNLILTRCLALTTLLQLSAAAFSQSWTLVWREDFGVAEDTVIKNFADPTMTVPNHYFINYEKYDEYNNNGVPTQKFRKLPEGQEHCGQIDDWFYGIANSTAWAYNRPHTCLDDNGKQKKGEYFTRGRDHTGNQNGAMLIINSGAGVGETIYSQDIDFDLCDAKKYRFKIFTSSITSFPAQKAMLTLIVTNRNTRETVAEIETNEIPLWEYTGESPFSEHKWSEYYADFTANNGDQLSLQIINKSISGVGNDFVIDDISLYRYDENVEVPNMKIEESAIASATGGNSCSYEAQFSVVNSVLEAWQKIDNSVYILWQKSEDDGLTWTNITSESGINKSKLSMMIDGTETTVFRVIVTASPTDEEAKEQAEYIAAHNAPQNGCAYYSISNTLSSIKPEPNCTYKEGLRTIWKEDFGVCDTMYAGTNSGMTLTPFVPGQIGVWMEQDGEYIICSVPDSAVYALDYNNKKEFQFVEGSWRGQDGRFIRGEQVGDAFAFIRMNKSNNKANPTFYKKTISVPLCPCKTFMFNAGFILNGPNYGTNLVTKMTVYDKSGNVLSSESVPLNYKNGVSKKMASVPFSVPTGYSGDITVEMALDYNYNENGISCADYSDFAIDDLSITICGEVMEKTTISIDGNSDITFLSGFECTDETPHSIILSGIDGLKRDYPNAAFIWQSSVDGGNTWENLSATTTSIAYEGEPEILYRVVIGETQSVANEVAANGKPADGCSIFYITNEVGFKCKESGCRAPKFSLDADEKVTTLDTVFCGTPDDIDIKVFQTNRVNVDEFYIATQAADNSYGAATALSPTPTSTDGTWTISLAKESANYMIYAVNDICNSDTLYINVDVREKLELKPLEDMVFCEDAAPEFKVELSSGKASELKFEFASNEVTVPSATPTDNIDVTGLALTAKQLPASEFKLTAIDGKCESEPIEFKINYEDKPSFTVVADANLICKGDPATLTITKNTTANAVNDHKYTIKGDDGNEYDDKPSIEAYPTVNTIYTIEAVGKYCDVPETKTVSVDVEVPQAIGLETLPSPMLTTITATNGTVCAPATVDFKASGTDLTTWDWEYKEDGDAQWTVWEAASTTLTKSKSITKDTYFRVSTAVASANVCNRANSDVITIKAEYLVNFTLELDKDRVCETGDVELSIVTTETYDADKVVATANGTPITLTNGKYKSTITADTEYSVEISGEQCTATPQTISATVDHPLNFTASADKDFVCKGSNVEFTLTGESTGIVWYSSTNGTDFDPFTMPSTLKWTSDTTRYFYASSPVNGACNQAMSETLKVEVERPFSEFDLNWIKPKHDDLLCKNEEAPFGVYFKKGVPTFVDVKVYVDNVLYTPTEVFHDFNGNTNFAPFIYKVKIPHTKTTSYKLEVTGKVCHVGNPFIKAYTVPVEELPIVDLSTTTPIICEGTPVDLTPALTNVKDTSIRYYQEVDGVRTEIPSLSNLTPAKNTTYYVSGGGVNCASVLSAGVPVEVDPKIDFELTSDVNGVVCEGTPANVKLKINSGNIVRHTFLANGTTDPYDIVANNTYSVLPTEPTTYELTLEGKACTAPSQPLFLNIEKKPTLSVNIDKNGICEGEFVTITPTATNAPSLVWEYSEDGMTFNADGSSMTEETRNPSSTTTYRITTAGKTTCQEESWSQKVEVEPAFGISFSAASTTACPGDDVEIVADITGLTNDLKVEWKKSEDNTRFTKIVTTNPTTVNAKLDTTTVFQIKVSGKYCEADSVTTTAIVDAVPTLTLEATADSICEGDEVTVITKFSSTNFDESTLTIKNGNDVLATGVQALVFNPEESMHIVATASTAAGCAIKPASADLYVDKAIDVIVPSDTILCEGGNVAFSVNSNKGYKYIWAIGEDTISKSYKMTYSGKESANVKLTASGKVCKETYDIGINVVSTPRIISVEESGSNAFNFVAEGGTGTYEFDFGKGYQSSSTLYPATYGRSYTIKVKDDLGCTSDTTIKTPVYTIEIPVVFTPNGDGENDKWEIKNIDKYPNSNIKLYDRYGKKLFDMSASEFENWDGTYLGKDMPSTDYWYEIDIDEINKTYVGHFTLIRSRQ